jgi:hypothetical protein
MYSWKIASRPSARSWTTSSFALAGISENSSMVNLASFISSMADPAKGSSLDLGIQL